MTRRAFFAAIAGVLVAPFVAHPADVSLGGLTLHGHPLIQDNLNRATYSYWPIVPQQHGVWISSVEADFRALHARCRPGGA